MRHRIRGYSLYEILMTLTLVAVIVGLGLPSYSGVVARNRQHVEINALFHAIHVARKESIMRLRVVTICLSFDGQACNPGLDWSWGWIMSSVNSPKMERQSTSALAFGQRPKAPDRLVPC